MYIDLTTLCQTHQLRPAGILHIGAHHGEERELYQRLGFTHVVWMEANPDLAAALTQRITEAPRPFLFETVIHAAVHEKENMEVAFNIATNTQASSLLELGTHKNLYPNVTVTHTIRLKTKRADTLLKQLPTEVQAAITLVNLDIQGAELYAIKGLGDFLKQIQGIYTEINKDFVYQGNPQIWDIDNFLTNHHFARKETAFSAKNSGWGDAFYVKSPPFCAPQRAWRRFVASACKRTHNTGSSIKGLYWLFYWKLVALKNKLHA